ncbi:hypothetical protein MMO38_11130 [Acinetobacter sp. NIPH 1852]|uniref:hypothetical protein n=1 Tax=Acinetobacter sp. NIPH 1852 TaxID=2923428 RepID=UPI001F4B9B78|nr:hypothetical protein [Acinetobacter sp. NIPH 1852]MCH7308680.1 hypothetical protein [Acinetobacter sp. NIPH 1852]
MSWQQQYLAYDQDSLATYANAGLVRRALKDIEAEKVVLRTEQADQVSIESDGQQVYLSATGLVNAVCSCPATGACKHIVAAVLWFQIHCQSKDESNDQAQENQISTPKDQPKNNVTEQIKINPLDEILALDLDHIAKKIGRVQAQKAIKYARLWQQEQQTELFEDDYRLKIHIASINEDISYIAGTGFAGMLSNLEKDQPAYHLAALSEVQRLQGKSWAALQLSEAENPAILSESERQFVVELQDDLNQLLEFGLSHVNDSTARQLHLLNMSARSEALPRLAAMLRQLSGQVSRLLQRDEHSSEQDTLLYLAQMRAYLYQLQQAQGEQLLSLRGKIRQQYQVDEQQPDLELLPLGARWWRTQGGARGLTLYFSELENAKTFEVTVARAENNDPNFNRYNAWSQHSIWMLTAQQLMQKTVRLQQPRFGEDGRLSASGQSRALPLNSLSKIEDFGLYQQMGFNHWQTVQQHWQQQMQTVEGIDHTILLNISRYDAPQVDEIEQCLWWNVYDQQGSVIHLRLDWKMQELDKIRQLERVCGQMIQVSSIFAHARIQGHQLVLSPISLLITQNDKTRLFHLDFDQLAEPKKTLKESLIGRIEQLMAKKKQQAKFASTQISLSQKVCEPILEVLLSLVCSGRLQLSTSQIETLQRQSQLAQDAGLSLLTKQIDLILATTRLNTDLILRLVYICDLTLKMQINLPIQLKTG